MDKPMKTAVITGATGAIGLALIDRLIKQQFEVLVLCNPDSSRKCRIPNNSRITLLSCAMQEYSRLHLSNQYDVFFHLAWMGASGAGRDDYYLQNENVRYTLDAVHLAKRLGCHTFVGTGSQAEYGRSDSALSPDSPVFPENGYAMAKLCAGQMTRMLCKRLGMRHLWARLFSIYGPGDGNNSMISYAIRTLLVGEKPALTPAEQQWDYLYATDAADALFRIAEKGQAEKIYCVGSGRTQPLRSYIEELRDQINEALPLGIGERPYASNQVRYLCADISTLERDTGFHPDIPFTLGIKKTIAWMKEELDGGRY